MDRILYSWLQSLSTGDSMTFTQIDSDRLIRNVVEHVLSLSDTQREAFIKNASTLAWAIIYGLSSVEPEDDDLFKFDGDTIELVRA